MTSRAPDPAPTPLAPLDPASLDPALPGLGAVFDPDALCALVAPVAADVGTVGRAKDVKWRPAERCTSVHEVARAGGATTFVVVEVTPAATAVRTFTDDPALPQLATLVDPDAVGVALGGPTTVTPLRYKPGARAVLRYDLADRGVVAKALAPAAQAAVRTTVAALAAAHAADPSVPRVAPLVDAPLAAVLQARVDGEELHDVVFDTARPVGARASLAADAAAALDALHGVDAGGGTAVAGADLADIADCERAVAAADPDLADRYRACRSALAAAFASLPAVPSVRGHNAFRTDQFLVDADGLVLIDLDTVRPAHPARDAGNLLAYLDWRALRRPADAASCALVAAAFDDPGDRALAVHRAGSLLKIAGRRYRSLAVAEWPLVPALLERVEVLVARDG